MIVFYTGDKNHFYIDDIKLCVVMKATRTKKHIRKITMKMNLLVSSLTTIVVGTAVLVTPLQAYQQLDEGRSHGFPKLKHQTSTAIAPTEVQRSDRIKHNIKLIKSDDTPPAHANILDSNEMSLCEVNRFATSNSNTLIYELQTQAVECVNQLFSASYSIKLAAYRSSNMIAVATKAKQLATDYQGNGDSELEKMMIYLRSGFYAKETDSRIIFKAEVKPASSAAIDAFVENDHFYDDNSEHGNVLSETLIAMDNMELQGKYLSIVTPWLNKWNASYAEKYNMRSSLNSLFMLLFRGQWNDNFVSLVATDTALVAALSQFTLKRWMLDSDAEYLIANAANELARLKQYTDTPIEKEVDIALYRIFSTYSMIGEGDAIWLTAADSIENSGYCNQFNICGFGEQVSTAILVQRHNCNANLTIYSQGMSAAQNLAACTSIEAENVYFHNKLQTTEQVVADDFNANLEMAIFNSPEDYDKYARAIFKIETGNGGMYLEGNPAIIGNVARFIAYQSDDEDAEHKVWNLEHEYIHYLDGRYDLYGDFFAPSEAIVWWAEGIAEYISKKDDNQRALKIIVEGPRYSLNNIFEASYALSNQDLIYRWGYLAVRFMFERYPNQVNAMLASTRTGDWSDYKSQVNTWSNYYSNEFNQWIEERGKEYIPPKRPIVILNGPYLSLTGEAIAFSSDGSHDPDGEIASYLWDFGDGSNSELSHPSHTYTAAGVYPLSLFVVDNDNSAEIAYAWVNVVEEFDGIELQNGKSVEITGRQNSETLFWIRIPESNEKQLEIRLEGGEGDADLYVKFAAEPFDDDNDCQSENGGNGDSCIIATPRAGIYFIKVQGYEDYSTKIFTILR